MNPDIEMEPDCLIRGISYLRANLDAAIVSPYVSNFNGEKQFLCKRYPSVFDFFLRGFTKALPRLTSLAFDSDHTAQESCRKLAEKNKVADRIKVGGLFSSSDFGKYENQPALIFCDIEGAKEELLDHSSAPALSNLDIIVESHECLRPGRTQKLQSRFNATHEMKLIKDNGSRVLDNMPPWFVKLSHLDQLLATWEWRSGLTPWLAMYAKESTLTKSCR